MLFHDSEVQGSQVKGQRVPVLIFYVIQEESQLSERARIFERALIIKNKKLSRNR